MGYGVKDFISNRKTGYRHEISEADFKDQANRFAKVLSDQDAVIDKLSFENGFLMEKLLECQTDGNDSDLKMVISERFKKYNELKEDVKDLQEDYADLRSDYNDLEETLKLRESQLKSALEMIKTLKS